MIAITTGIIATRSVIISLIFVDNCFALRNCSLGSRLANVDKQLTGLNLSAGLSVKDFLIVCTI